MVYISTPIGTHEEWAIKAASEGKHVYCEKSSTTSFESAKKILNIVKQNNVRIMEGFMFKFHSQHQKVRELITNNKIGEMICFNGIFGFPKFPEEDIRYNKNIKRITKELNLSKKLFNLIYQICYNQI